MTNKCSKEYDKIDVYKITNVVTGRVYVGSTTDSFRHRWYAHRYELNRNTHGNAYLQNSWNKYGEEAFEFTVLEELCDVGMIYEREQYWIDHYRESEGGCYNIRDVDMCTCVYCNDGLESIDAYKLDAIEAIKRDSLKRYAEYNMVHSSCRVSAEILDDVADIRRMTGLPESKIYRGLNMHGASLIQHKYDDKSRKFDELAGKLSRTKDPKLKFARRMASQTSESSLINSMDYRFMKNVRFAEWANSYLSSFGEKMFIVHADMIRAAFCFALSTWENAINRDIYEKEVSNFGDYVDGKLFVFEATYEKYENENDK